MREVKEKRLLKERAAETLKSAPRTAFRRGTDAATLEHADGRVELTIGLEPTQ